MKFAPFIHEYVTSDDWEFLEDMSGFNDTKEFFGFDVPFTEKDLNNKNWDDFREYLEKWIKEHQLKIVASEIVYYDLEKAYNEVEVVFSFEGKYYKTKYIDSIYLSHFYTGYPDCPEVFPHTVTITKYY